MGKYLDKAGLQALWNALKGKLVGEKTEGKQFTVDDEQVTAGEGAERFNGDSNIATGDYSHAEGNGAIASGEASHAEGKNTMASGYSSHAEGNGAIASREASHAEGSFTTASGYRSHAEGGYTTASGQASHAEGIRTTATNDYEHAEGRFNKSNTGSTDAEKTRHSVGIGTDNNARKNAFEIMANGDIYVYGLGGYNGTNALRDDVKTLQELLAGAS